MKNYPFPVSISLIFCCIFFWWAFTNPVRPANRYNEKDKILDFVSTGDPSKIPYLDLLRMMAKYRDERQEIINQQYAGNDSGQYGINFQDSRAFTFELQDLKDFISYVESQVDNNDLNVSFDAIRIYPIVYPNIGTSSYSDSIPYNQRNHLSLVMVAGYKDENGEVIDFDPDLFETAEQGGTNVPKSLDKPSGSSLNSFLDSLFGTSDTIRAFTALNHAGLCPPPNNCLTSFLKNADEVCPNSSACQY